MSSLCRGSIDADIPHLGHVHHCQGFIHEVMGQAPELGVVNPEHLGGSGNRQRGNLHHRQHLEQQGDLGAWAGPGHGDLLDSMLITITAWHSGSEVGGMLEEVHVLPDTLLGVVGLARLAADRVREVRLMGEVDEDIQTLYLRIELEVLDLPRGLKAERNGEEGSHVHGFISLGSRAVGYRHHSLSLSGKPSWP